MHHRLPLRHDDNLHILGEGDDSLDEIPGQQGKPLAIRRPCEKDLRDLISTREIYQSGSRVLAFENSSLDVQVAREVQMPVDSVAVTLGDSAQIAGSLNGDSKTLRLEKITHALGA